MPYINKIIRKDIKLGLAYPRNAGELNYVITRVLTTYLNNNGKKYQQFNDIIGALEGAKMEIYRRLIGPYENVKCNENGDVY